MKFHIWCQGDRSVGIPGDSVVLDWPALKLGDPEKMGEVDTEYVSFVKETLHKAFVQIFDDKSTIVMTGEEFEKYTAVEE